MEKHPWGSAFSEKLQALPEIFRHLSHYRTRTPLVIAYAI